MRAHFSSVIGGVRVCHPFQICVSGVLVLCTTTKRGRHAPNLSELTYFSKPAAVNDFPTMPCHAIEPRVDISVFRKLPVTLRRPLMRLTSADGSNTAPGANPKFQDQKPRTHFSQWSACMQKRISPSAHVPYFRAPPLNRFPAGRLAQRRRARHGLRATCETTDLDRRSLCRQERWMQKLG